MIERLDHIEPTTDFHGIARQFPTIVPAFTATTVVWEAPQWRGIFLSWARKPFDERVVVDLIHHVNSAWDGALSKRGMILLPNFHPSDGRFETVLLLQPAHHGQFRTEDAVLFANSIMATPVYEGEFRGDESPDKFDYLIHWRSDIGNWNRQRPADRASRNVEWNQETLPGYSND